MLNKSQTLWNGGDGVAAFAEISNVPIPGGSPMKTTLFANAGDKKDTQSDKAVQKLGDALLKGYVRAVRGP